MVYLYKIWDFLKKMDLRFILLMAVLILLFLNFKQCDSSSKLEAEKERNEKIASQNQRALRDKIRETKNKIGENEFVISSFISKLEDLEKLNKNLYNEIKKEVGNVKALVIAGGNVSQKPLNIDNSLIKYDNNNYGLAFEKTTNADSLYTFIKGVSKFKIIDNNIFAGQTNIEQNSIKFKLILGFKEEKNGSYTVFARSPSPLIQIDELSGTLIIPRKNDPLLTNPVKNKKFSVGPYLGVGLDMNFKPSLQIGVGISYNLIRF